MPENDELKKIALHSSLEEIKDRSKTLTPAQITFFTEVFNQLPKDETIERTLAFLENLNSTPSLEGFGNGLSDTQFFEILRHIYLHPEMQKKLAPILVGFPYLRFKEVLKNLNEATLQVLQNEGSSEPLRHQLSVLVHELEQHLDKAVQEKSRIQKELKEVDPSTLTGSQLAHFKSEIQQFLLQIDSCLLEVNHALSIAWHTNRPDLIENLTRLKEAFFRTLTDPMELIGQNFSKVFGEEGSAEIASNEESSMEGLVKFSLWYIPDYWEMGLLPRIRSKDELDLDPAVHDEQERSRLREALLSEIQENLNTLGLKTVKDLKQHHIYSRDLLKTYIEEHRHLLK